MAEVLFPTLTQYFSTPAPPLLLTPTPHGPFSTLCGFYHGNYARAITAALHEELEVPGWVQDRPLQIIGEGHEIQLPCLNA